jgi:hypothetical protein
VTTYSTLASAVIGSDFDKSSISNSLVGSLRCINGEFGAIYLVLKRSADALLIKLLNWNCCITPPCKTLTDLGSEEPKKPD